MSLIEMTVTGSVLILAVLAIRAVGVCKLPKKALILMWGLCVLRLLLPISIALPILPAEPQISYSNSHTAPAPTASQPNVYTGQSVAPEEITVPEESAVPQNPAQIPSQADTSAASPMSKIEPSTIANIWLAGFAALALYFAIGYARATRRYRQSLPVESDFVKSWQTEHEKLRKISIRYSDMISSPLTYGLLHPVILLPKSTDFEEKERLSYILEHEYAHIRHLDALAKLIAALVLCLHWFNPLVWVMYILYNRDMELWCDECVLRRYGKASRASYAQLLIEMAETRAESQPLLSHFGRNCVQERIVSIMKFRKTTIISAIVAVLLTFAITVTVVASAINPVAKENPVQHIADNPTSSPDTSSAYQKLAALKTADYAQKSIADFNTALAPTDEKLLELLAANADVRVSPDDENYDFIMTTIALSANELYCEHMGEQVTFYVTISKRSRPYDYLDEYGDIVYGFNCFADLQVDYRIISPDLVSVEQRDMIFKTLKSEFQNYLDSLSEEEISGGNLRTMLADKFSELEKKLSTDNLKLLSCNIGQINLIDADAGIISSLGTVPDVEWWTYDEYKAWLENEKVELQGMIGEKGWTGGRGDFIWTQEIVDETIAMYEDILEQIKNGLLVSKTVDGSDDIMLAQGRDSIDSVKEGQPVYMTDKDIAKDSILHEGEAFSWFVDRDSKLPDITEYAHHGISVDADNRLLYNGERVRYFCDGAEINHGEWSIRQSYYFADGTVDVFTVRETIANADGSLDWCGKLLGLRKSTQEEFDRTNFAYVGDMQYTATDYSSDYDYKTGYLHEPHGDNLSVTETTESFGDGTTTGKTFSEMFEKYSQYGIEYRHCEDGGRGDLFLNGEAVSNFSDISPNGAFTFESTHGGNCSVVCDYDEYGKLCGVHKVEHHEDKYNGKGMTFEEYTAKYAQYDVEFRICKNCGQYNIYLNGETVSSFWDIYPSGGAFSIDSAHGGNGTVVCDYDDKGELCGVHKIKSEHHEDSHDSHDSHHEDSHSSGHH